MFVLSAVVEGERIRRRKDEFNYDTCSNSTFDWFGKNAQRIKCRVTLHEFDVIMRIVHCLSADIDCVYYSSKGSLIML